MNNYPTHMTAYKVLSNHTAENLNIQIAKHLAKGWLPYGNHTVTRGFNWILYSQGMYHPGITNAPCTRSLI